MRERLIQIEKRYQELGELLSDPDVTKDQARLAELGKEYAELRETMALYQKLKDLKVRIDEDEEILRSSDDSDLVAIAQSELDDLMEEREQLERQIIASMVKKDPNDDKNCIVEVRAGAGGDEAGLFVSDLVRMYERYVDRRGWKVEPMSSHATEIGGFKEMIFMVQGKGAYGCLKHERGVHRVQRVPVTESGGRIHTSTATVAVLPEAQEVEVTINPDDLKTEVFRAGGPGGQYVNVTDSAVRITHIPTGIVVSCQDERSQHKNKAKAMTVLRARLYDRMRREQEEKLARDRREQVGTGERSEKIRTYNFPQNRVTDHRLNFTTHQLEQVLQGELDEIIERLAMKERIQSVEV